jgi:hypothetical protein
MSVSYPGTNVTPSTRYPPARMAPADGKVLGLGDCKGRVVGQGCHSSDTGRGNAEIASSHRDSGDLDARTTRCGGGFPRGSETLRRCGSLRLGELRDVQAAGYPNFLGMAGLHRFFHTPADDLRTTSPEILEPVARAFADAVRKAAERGERAFK